MRAELPAVLLVLVALACAAPAEHGAAGPDGPIEELRATLELSPREATLGDPITATLTVDVPDGSNVRFPPDGGDWAPLTLLEAAGTDVQPVGEGARHRAVYRLAAFAPGTLEVPPRQVLVGDGDDARPLDVAGAQVEVLSLLADAGEDPQIADIKPPALLPFPSRWLPWMVAGLLLLGAAAAYQQLRRRRGVGEVEVEAAPPPPPDEEALAALERLLAGDLLRQGKVKEFHVELAEISKRYLSRRFQVLTLERTTFEVLRDARAARLDGWVTDRLASILSACDNVKFAQQRPATSGCRAAAEEARELVRRTRRPPPVAAPGELLAAEG